MLAAAFTENETHPFELAGLGKAPFRVVGTAERIFQACPGAPVKAGGCCKYCYTGIRYAAIIRSIDGNAFDVGMDCVRKVDMKAYKEARDMRRAELRETRSKAYREAAAAAAAARRAEEDRQAVVLEAAFRAAQPELASIIDALAGDDGFAGSRAAKALANVRAWGTIANDDDREHDEWKLRELHAEKTASGHVGTAGDRGTFRARYVGRYVYETSFGRMTIYKLSVAREDGSHGLLVWKTAACLTDEKGQVVELGADLDVKATVKDHGDFHGVPQTSVTRPKFVRVWRWFAVA